MKAAVWEAGSGGSTLPGSAARTFAKSCSRIVRAKSAGSAYIQGMEAPVNWGRLFVLVVTILGGMAVYKVATWAGPALCVAVLVGVALAFTLFRVTYGRWP